MSRRITLSKVMLAWVDLILGIPIIRTRLCRMISPKHQVDESRSPDLLYSHYRVGQTPNSPTGQDGLRPLGYSLTMIAD
jgi:hypothetical protein